MGSRGRWRELVARLIEAGLLERLRLLWGEPALLRATQGRDRLLRPGVSAGAASQRTPGGTGAPAPMPPFGSSATGARGVHKRARAGRAEEVRRRPIASAQLLSSYDDYGRGLHRPDLVIRRDGGQIAVEVELTARPRSVSRRSSAAGGAAFVIGRSTSALEGPPTARSSGRSWSCAGERGARDLAEIAPTGSTRADGGSDERPSSPPKRWRTVQGAAHVGLPRGTRGRASVRSMRALPSLRCR